MNVAENLTIEPARAISAAESYLDLTRIRKARLDRLSALIASNFEDEAFLDIANFDRYERLARAKRRSK